MVHWSEGGELRTLISESYEKETGLVLAQRTELIVEEEQETTGSATMIVNTYNQRCYKSIQERDPGTEKALVVWVDNANKGKINKCAVQVEELEGHIANFPRCS